MKLMSGNYPRMFQLRDEMNRDMVKVMIDPGNCGPDPVVKIAEKIQERAKYCFQTLDKLQPGFSPVRAKTLFMQAMAQWAALTDIRKAIGMDILGVCNPETTSSELIAARQVTREAEAALLADPCISNEGLLDNLKMYASSIESDYAEQSIWNDQIPAAAAPNVDPPQLVLGLLGTCVACGKQCNSQCYNCRKVTYCSKECQLAHMKEHKPDCFPLQKVPRPLDFSNYDTSGGDTGGFWSTTRAIKQGEILLLEQQPLIEGPSSDFADEPGRPFYSICLSCCKILSVERDNASVNKCSKCKWFVCDSTCEKKSCHKMECDLFAKHGITPRNEPMEYKYIRYLRTIFLKSYQPEKWAQIESLMSSLSFSDVVSAWDCDPMLYNFEMCQVEEFLLERCGLRSEVGTELLTKLIVIWKKFRLVDLRSFYKCGIFSDKLVIVHSCVPNCVSILSNFEAQTCEPHKVLAICDIAAGKLLGGSGDWRLSKGAALLKGTRSRREILANEEEGGPITCYCHRCVDPTELGTYYSAIRCPEKCQTATSASAENVGYILPIAPLEDKSDWACNNPTCRKTLRVAQVDAILNPIAIEVNAILELCDKQSFEVLSGRRNDEDKKLIEKMERCLEKFRAVLHPNHYFLLELTLKVMTGSYPLLHPFRDDVERRRYTDSIMIDPHNFGQDPLVKLAQKIQERAKYSLKILDKIQPGRSPIRGKTLFLQAMAQWAALTDRRKEIGMEIPGICNPETTRSELIAARQVTREAREALLADPSCFYNQNLLANLNLCAETVEGEYAEQSILKQLMSELKVD